MNLLTLLLVCGVILVIAYFTYGRFLERQLKVDSNRKTPAYEMYDGVDYVPAKKTCFTWTSFRYNRWRGTNCRPHHCCRVRLVSCCFMDYDRRHFYWRCS